MAKDREGKFHPRKKQPAATADNANANETGTQKDQFEIADKYTVGEEEPAPNLRVRHPNRSQERRGEFKKSSTSKSKQLTPRTIQTDVEAKEILSLTKEDFSSLAADQSSPCVSIYIATHGKGAEANSTTDITNFRKTLQQVTAQLKERKSDETDVEKLLKPAHDLLQNEEFWANQSMGLAVFINDETTQYIKLPFSPSETVFINTSFYLGPLISLLSNDYFYLLMLSKKQAKFFRAGTFGMVELIIDEMPNGVEDVVHLEEKDDKNLFRTGSSGAGSGASYHGTGSSAPDDKENLKMYFDEVDETLWKKLLNREHAPLLLSGVEYLIPIYKSVAQYKPIWDEAITGNYEHTDFNSIYQHARKIMQPYFDERHGKALEQYGNQSATDLTTSVVDDVIPAAHYKRISHLFVQEGERVWGSFDEMNNKLVMHESQEEHDEDLIDKAVIKTLLGGGEVHFLPKEKMPDNSRLAAILRY